MSRHLCVVQDFLTVPHRMRIRETAAAADFIPHFFTSAEKEAAIDCLQTAEVLYAQIPELVRKAPALRWFACSSAGVDVYCTDPSPFQNPDCILTNSNVYGVTIAEHVVMVSLMLLRRMTDYQAALQEHRWPAHVPIRSIRDGRFTILGTGNIGQNAARRLRGMGAARITGVSRSGRSTEGFDEVCPISQLDEVLSRTEFLIAALPGTPETVNLLDRRRIGLLPERAYLVNVGRGTVLDQAALADALNSGHLAGAALDVFAQEPLPAEDPLWNAANVIITPHVSGDTTLGYTCDENVRLFCENLARYGAGEPLHSVIDRRRGY